jgi:hypothetical protein
MAEIEIYAKPSSLFRYRPLGPKAQRECEALLHARIFCPSFADMNDPMEGTYRLSKRFLDSRDNDTRDARVKMAFENMGIASLSEVYDHEPMWAHYADQFRGMCIQYSLNRLLKGLSNGIAISRMMYSEKEPVLLMDGSSASDRARMCLSSKTVRWANEREWRIFIPEKGEAHYGDPNAVTRIYLGSRVSEEDEQRIVATASVLGVSVLKMSVDAYSLKFKTILKGDRSERDS